MYSTDLLEILTLDIPQVAKIEEGFLDITGQQFKENVISRIYAYFLNPEKNKKISEIFLNSLLEIIAEKTGKTIIIESFRCNTEVSTKSQNRIDLFIDSEDEEKCIILENKIFHNLHNDLLDYWEYRSYPEQNKAGVLLTLNNTTVPFGVKNKYVNITHLEWVTKIKGKGVPLDLNANEFVYLSDFIKNMENISKAQQMDEQVKFYFENTDKVLRAIQTYDAAFNYVIAQLKIVAEKMNWELSGFSEGYRHIWDKENEAQIYYAIEIGELLEKKSEVVIIIEMYKEALKKEEHFINTLSANMNYNQLEKDCRRGPGWLHFAQKRYKLSKNDKENLSVFLLEKINRDFKPVMDILLKESK